MGIISTLLSGGVLIGKVCQGLSSAFGSAYVDSETGERIAVAETALCGVKFYQSVDNVGKVSNRALNSNTNYDVTVVFPNDAAGNGVSYDVPSTQKIDITGDLAADHAPDKEILVGPARSSNSDEMTAGRAPLMKVSFNNLAVGGAPVYISDYKISCDTSGIKVNSATRKLGALKYFNMTSDTGVLINDQSSVDTASNGADYSYDIELDKLGLKKGDILSGQLHIEIDGSDMQAALDASKAQPLTEVEKRAFRALGIIK